VTIAGTSGSLVQTAAISLTVTPAPSYTLSAAADTLSVAQGSQGKSTITITPVNGFAGTVTLSAAGLPTGVTASFTRKTATSTSVLTLKAKSSATEGTLQLPCPIEFAAGVAHLSDKKSRHVKGGFILYIQNDLYSERRIILLP
jgi:DNA-binding beta-propeller fold protein YncE